jgi:N-acetyltransferase
MHPIPRPDFRPTLEGELVILRPVRAEDWNALYAVASDPLIWEQHPAHDRWQEAEFRGYFEWAIENQAARPESCCTFVVIDKATGDIIGSTRFDHYEPEHPDGPDVEVGWTFLARSHWGGRYNAEMKRLLLAHAFRFVKRVVFHVGPENTRSRLAMERIGAACCGLVERAGPDGPVQRLRYVIRRPGE